MDEEYLKRLGLSIARGVPQMATGLVDLAALPFTLTGLLEPEQAVGSTDWMTKRGYLPPKQEGLLPETLEMVSGAMSPGGAGKELLSGLLGVTAYHGSPYLFKQLDKARIGTGEGAQAYGAGAGYTSEGRPVAESYRASVAALKKNAGQDIGDVTIKGNPINWDNPEEIAAFELARHAGDRKAAADFHARTFLGGEENPAVKLLRSEAKLPQIDMPGYLYKGDIPDEIIPSFLDWDKPLKNQEAFSKIKDHPEIVAYAQKTGKDVGEIKGKDAYELIASGFDVGQQEAYPLATQYLDSLGVRGVRYLDQGSKSDKGLTTNFVVFRPEDYQIQEINDIPLEEYLRKGLLN